jgi:KaiC/GvpD/RAD55 family RecA-like ATPase
MWDEKEISIGEIKDLLDKGYEIEADSPDGWVGVNFFVDKGMWDEYVLVLDNGLVVRCNEAHLFETPLGWQKASDLTSMPKQHYLTRDGYVVGEVVRTGRQIPIVDINVDHENHRYYTNGISSHNTGAGKSLFMCHFAASTLMQGLNVLYITMEMAEERIAERIDANLMNLSMDELKVIDRKVFDARVAKIAGKTQGKLIVKEYPTASAHSGHFRALLEELKGKMDFKPDVLIIDYLNICSSARLKMGASVNSYTYIKSIAEELRGLAVEYNVPVLTATQVTRGGFNSSDVELTDTSESFGLPATADLMFALIRSEEMDALNQIMVKQLKNRYADPSSYKRFVIGVDRSKMKLYDVEESAQDGLADSGQDDDTPLFDKTSFGKRVRREGDFGGFK